MPPRCQFDLKLLIASRLAEVVELRLQLKQAQWNAGEPASTGLPELFERIATELESCTDIVAGRLVQLGGIADGRLRPETSLAAQPTPAPPVHGAGMRLNAVARALSDFRCSALATVDKSLLSADPVTAALFTQIYHDMDKWVRSIAIHARLSKSRLTSNETEKTIGRPEARQTGRPRGEAGRQPVHPFSVPDHRRPAVL